MKITYKIIKIFEIILKNKIQLEIISNEKQAQSNIGHRREDLYFY